jgi:hypothetical protein
MDKLTLHRQLFAADRLLQKKKGAAESFGTEAERQDSGVNAGLDAPNSAAAILEPTNFIKFGSWL